jgi:chloramphenicol O-acetyltransferase type A
MRTIDIETWPRRNHYLWLKDFDFPHFSMCANVDLTIFYPAVKQCSISINIGIVYVLARAANAIPEFRTRMRGAEVVEHEIVHPSTTILTDDNLFTFCPIDFSEDFRGFASTAEHQIELAKAQIVLTDEPETDHWLFMTAIPWVSFTSFMHPLKLNPVDSVPRFAWGKFFKEGNSIKMPLSVQGHHALMDGIHMGRFYEIVQELLLYPNFLESLDDN